MVTLADVARHAGVSKTQVSFVLNQKNLHLVSAERRTRIAQSIRDLDYRPNLAARHLAGKSTRLLGLLLPAGAIPVHGPIIQAALTTARMRGYQMIVNTVPSAEDALANALAQLEPYDLDGVICFARGMLGHADNLGEQLERFRRVVTIGSPNAGHTRIGPDHRAAMRSVVHYLADTGRQRIGMILPVGHEHGLDDRILGVDLATEDLGWSRNDEFTVRLPRSADPWPDSTDTQSAIDRLVLEAGVDAIIAYDDIWAARIVQMLQRGGWKIPREVAVVGYGNLPIAELTAPALTTVDLQERHMGLMAVDHLITAIEDNQPLTHDTVLTVESRMVSRASA
ncbi:MAG: LacI family DNA-binding transcriptional regulator [Phycisphaeraceae bacterium]